MLGWKVPDKVPRKSPVGNRNYEMSYRLRKEIRRHRNIGMRPEPCPNQASECGAYAQSQKKCESE
jgi:hypothetical protein